MPVAVGQAAPDFTLPDQHGHEVTLSSYRGRGNVVLVFYPFTFTGVCQGELCALRDDRSDFTAKHAQVIAISCDSRHAQQRWAERCPDAGGGREVSHDPGHQGFKHGCRLQA